MGALIRISLAVAMVATCLLVHAEPVHACGCFSPPQPPPGVTAEQYAVAQQAEQIIFEVEDGTVTAHVLIRYEGAPESFAWIVPVPAAPELSLSENVAFALLDDQTKPFVGVSRSNICPSPHWRCRSHPPPVCDTGDRGPRFATDAGGGGAGADAGAFGPGGEQDAPPVDVISRQVIGSYDTIVFDAADAALAVTWLQDEGFIVNDTMTPYMQPYLDAGMLFVASRLVPGAGVEEIKPLRMQYAADAPMVPLQLTAVAAEPHLTVTSYIFGDTPFEPDGLPITTVDATRISVDPEGRSNYPMVLASAVDEAGGDAFVVEYSGAPPRAQLGTDPFCCGSGFDNCALAGDGTCQCPRADFDRSDCSEIPGLIEGMDLVDDLADRHARVTRLTTRISPEEMTFDPGFRAAPGSTSTRRLSLNGNTRSLASCEGDIIDRALYESILGLQACASLYCGVDAVCGPTALGPGCSCAPGNVVRTFTDLDGEPSVTCVPDTPPVDLAAGGLALPDACEGIDCGAGGCVDLGGFAACRCNPGAAGVVVEGASTPVCRALLDTTGTPGADDYSAPLESVQVCAPAPPRSCGEFGWLEPTTPGIPGVLCASSMPNPALLDIPPAPTCADVGLRPPIPAGGGCSTSTIPVSVPLGGGLFAFAVALIVVRRRRIRNGR